MRSFGPYPDHPILDAVGFSPAQIKQILDLSVWSQETEDKFRGVDGREITSQRGLFDPSENERPKMSEEEREEVRKEAGEVGRKTVKRIEVEKEEEVNLAEKYVCGNARSNYDLRPRPRPKEELCGYPGVWCCVS